MVLTDKQDIAAWKPISEITDADVEMGDFHHRLIVYNSCTGPHVCHPVSDGYFEADDFKREGVWEKFSDLTRRRLTSNLRRPQRVNHPGAPTGSVCHRSSSLRSMRRVKATLGSSVFRAAANAFA
ncbi:hypothetical protein [Chelativorans sp. YIM 93263]|uniref:hypothetical protein n=1 Tax=Chelativorans sp. YIM 93263 TaxID=2906648 RepID=UPI00237A007C|nr:hypothetical protein [Chelativorans sp. YIM 93263]